MFLYLAVGGIFIFCLGFWMGEKDTEEEREISFLQGQIIHDLEVYLRNKKPLTLAEETLKVHIQELREML